MSEKGPGDTNDPKKPEEELPPNVVSLDMVRNRKLTEGLKNFLKLHPNASLSPRVFGTESDDEFVHNMEKIRELQKSIVATAFTLLGDPRMIGVTQAAINDYQITVNELAISDLIGAIELYGADPVEFFKHYSPAEGAALAQRATAELFGG